MPKENEHSKQPRTRSEDVALPVAKTDAGLHILRRRDNSIEAGVVRPLQEGKPIDGEVVQLKPRGHGSPLFDVEVKVAAPKQSLPALTRASHGPPQVATDEYRTNWDAIFSQKTERLLN